MGDSEKTSDNTGGISSSSFDSYTSSSPSSSSSEYLSDSSFRPPYSSPAESSSSASSSLPPSPPLFVRYKPAIPPGEVDASTVTNEEWRKIEADVSRWLQDSHYQITTEEKRPFFRVANISLTSGLCVGFTVNFLLKRYIPPNKTIFPHWLPSLFLGFSAAQMSVHTLRKGAYEKVLKMETPLGDAARASLLDVRHSRGGQRANFLDDKYAAYVPPPHGYAHPGAASYHSPPTSYQPPLSSYRPSSAKPDDFHSSHLQENYYMPSDGGGGRGGEGEHMNGGEHFRKNEAFNEESGRDGDLKKNDDFLYASDSREPAADAAPQKGKKDGYRSWDEIRKGPSSS